MVMSEKQKPRYLCQAKEAFDIGHERTAQSPERTEEPRPGDPLLRFKKLKIAEGERRPAFGPLIGHSHSTQRLYEKFLVQHPQLVCVNECNLLARGHQTLTSAAELGLPQLPGTSKLTKIFFLVSKAVFYFISSRCSKLLTPVP